MLRAVAFLLLAGVSAAGLHAEELPFHVVVHPSNPVTSLTRAELSAIFMKRTRSWPDGSEIVAADRPASARVRGHFSRAIHGKRVAYVIRYWQRLIFAGRGIPPREFPSDAAVLDFVRANRGAIGYIDRTMTPDGVKTIAVTP